MMYTRLFGNDVTLSRLLFIVAVVFALIGARISEWIYRVDAAGISTRSAGHLAADSRPMWIGLACGSVLGLIVRSLLLDSWGTQFGGGEFRKKIRGVEMVSPIVLSWMCRDWNRQLRFAGIPVPKELETTQFFVGGSTGTGKSVCISGYIESLLARGDRLACIDPDGGYLRYFFRPGDHVVNPFDQRGEGWTIFNEIRSEFDCERYAHSMIPRNASAEGESFNSMGRTIVAQLLIQLLKQGDTNSDRVVHWLTSASNTDLKALLAGTPAEGCFHGAEETLASIRTVLTQYITPHRYLIPGSFSIRDWLETGQGNLWFTWREDMLQALRPLISCWADVFCASVLSMEEDPGRRIHLVIDELDSLERLNYLTDAATKGRKKGLRILPGVQTLAQLDATYGPKDALALRNSFRSTFLCGISELDTYTAEEFSRAIGEHTVIRRRMETEQKGVRWDSETERVVTPAEFHLLPNLEGYLKFAGDYPLARVRLKRKARPRVAPAIVPSAPAPWQAEPDQTLFASAQ